MLTGPACAGATGTESQNATTANPSIAIERVRLRTYTSAYQGSASPSPVNSFQANEQASTIADVPGTQVSPSQALNLGSGITSGQAMNAPSIRALFELTADEEGVCFINFGTVSARKPPRTRATPQSFVSSLPAQVNLA